MKIVIMRHGRPKMALDKIVLEEIQHQKMSPNRVGEILFEYDLSGLAASETPPSNSIELASNCDISVSSDIQRALDSINLLGLAGKNSVDECFREVPLPYLKWSKPRLSYDNWALMFRLAWYLGFSSNGESFFSVKKRVSSGARKLTSYARTYNSVFFLGHMLINRRLINELKKIGWQEIENTGEKYWSYSVIEFRT